MRRSTFLPGADESIQLLRLAKIFHADVRSEQILKCVLNYTFVVQHEESYTSVRSTARIVVSMKKSTRGTGMLQEPLHLNNVSLFMIL